MYCLTPTRTVDSTCYWHWLGIAKLRYDCIFV